jgi:hypothetical protein
VAVSLASIRQAAPNADDLYFDLVVTANVTATGAGQIRVVATLSTGNGTVYLVSNDTWAPFNGSAGQATLSVHLSGPLIRSAGFDGPYSLYLFAQGSSSDGNTPGNYVTNTTMTPAFTAASFAPLWADVLGPITYSTPDTDHDGLADALIAHIPVVVSTAAPVDIWGSLSATNSNGYNGFGSAGGDASRFLTPGAYTWDLVFPGHEIRGSGLNGPYLLSVFLRFPFLYPGYGNPNAVRAFTTPAYTFSQFGPPAITLRAPITASLEPSGLTADALEVVHVPLHIQAAGNYTIQAVPYTPYWGLRQSFGYPTTQAVAYRSLPAGDTTVDLTFSSLVLKRWPVGQNFTLQVSAYPIGAPYAPASPFGSVSGNGFWTLWTERNVTASLLPSRPVAWVNVSATYGGQLCPELRGAVAELQDHFYFQNSSGGLFGVPATVDLQLYPGTFELFLSGCGASSLQTLTVTGTEALSFALTAPPPVPPDRYTMTFPAWNDSVTDFVSSQLGGPAARFEADLAGNWDGTASSTELAIDIQTQVWSFIPALLTMDGTDYWSPDWVFTGVQGAGPVTSTAPVTASVRYEARVPVTPNSGGHHTITLHMYYVANGFRPYQVDLQLPFGVQGSLNVSATASAWSSTSAPANVSVQTLGPGSWRLTPGAPPPNYSFSWAVVTVSTGSGTPPSGSAPGTIAGLETILLPVALFLAAGLVLLVALLVALRRPPGKSR